MGCPAHSKAPATVLGLRDGGSASADTNEQAARGTGWRKQSAEGRSAGNRSAFIVLRTTGNRGRWDPSEKGGRRMSRTPEGTRRGN